MSEFSIRDITTLDPADVKETDGSECLYEFTDPESESPNAESIKVGATGMSVLSHMIEKLRGNSTSIPERELLPKFAVVTQETVDHASKTLHNLNPPNAQGTRKETIVISQDDALKIYYDSWGSTGRLVALS